MSDTNKIVLTGIKPTGMPHLGNYVGALKPLIERSQTHKTFMFIADLHALNTIHDASQIRQHTYEIAALLVALGLNLENAVLFRQSDIDEIYQLNTLLMNITPKGLMNRAHSYKAAMDKNTAAGLDVDAGINMGLYTYPILMSADILLYNSDIVPVGADTGLIPGLDGRKMSKSYDNIIPLFAPESELKKKVMRIITDSKLPADKKDPDESTIYHLYKHFATPEQTAEFAEKFRAGGMGYGDAKKILFEQVNSVLAAPRAEYERLMSNPDEIDKILASGAARARMVAHETLLRVKRAMLG